MQPQNFYNQSPKQQSNQNQPSPASQKVADFIRKHRTLSIVIAVLVVFIPLGLIILNISNFIDSGSQTEANHQAQPEIAPLPYVEYQDRERFEDLIGETLSTEILYNINNIIVSNNEITSAPSPFPITDDTAQTYTISIKEAPFTPPAGEEYFFMKFNVTVDDGRKYTLWFRTDLNYAADYVVIILDRTDSTDTPDYINYYIDGEDLNVIPQSVTNWINSLHLIDPQVEIFPLPEVKHINNEYYDI